MTPLEDFKKILKENGIEDIPEESLVEFRDMVDTQSDLILDSFLSEKLARTEAKKQHKI